MANYKITYYQAKWNPASNWGEIRLYWNGGYVIIPSSTFAGPDEFYLCWKMVKEEEPVYYDTSSGSINFLETPDGY
jgi:hypothetical protein